MAHNRGFSMLRYKHMLAGLVMAASTVSHSSEFVTATVVDHVVQKIREVPVEETVCQKQQVPVYSDQRQGPEPSFGDLVVGAAIGSAIGNAISDKPGVGTLGGVIGAHSVHKNRSEPTIVGYREQDNCFTRTSYDRQPVEVYSHSTATFSIDGRQYSVRFNRYR